MQNVYVYCSNEALRLNEALNKLIKEQEVDEFNISKYNFLDTEPLEILNDLETISLLGDKKLVAISNPIFLKSGYNDKEVLKKFIDYFNLDNPDTICVLLVDFKLEFNLVINQVLKEKAQIVVFEDLSGAKLDEWIYQSFNEAGYKINNDAIEELILRTGGDLLLISNEILKLECFKEESKVINYEDITLMVSKNLEDNIFNLLNAFLMNDKNQVLKIYNDFMAVNEDEMRIMNAFSNKLEEIYYTKVLLKQGLNKDDIAGYFKVKPGRAYYMIENAKRLSDYDLVNLINKLTNLDYEIKSGKIDKKLGLQLFILGA